MTNERIDKKTLENQLPAILREQLQRDGLPRDHLPSWEYITANTRYSAQGLHLKCQEFYDKSIHEFLRENGFGARSSGKWPTDDEITQQSFDYYIDSLTENKDRAGGTIDSVTSTINKIYEAIHEEDLNVELLDIGYYDSEKERINNIQDAKAIIQYIDRQLADDTLLNYTNYFSEYYEIVENRYQINLNPVEEALDEFDWNRTGGDPHPVTVKQIRNLWNTLDALEECPIERYDLDQWRLWMKVLLVFIVAVGPRSNEVEKLDLRTQLHFGEDPHVHFETRKNLDKNEAPEKVPIMTGAGFLKAYVDYITTTGKNGRLVPSPQSQSGSRVPATLNDWLAALCKAANVRLDDGTHATIQNFRQFWKTHYKDAVHQNRDEMTHVSDEGGTDNPKVDEDRYTDPEKNRQHIRDLGREQFDDILDLNELPALVQKELEQNQYINRQADFDDFNTDSGLQ